MENNYFNIDNSILFFKIFRNKFLLNKILSFLQEKTIKNGFSYNGTTNLDQMVGQKKYEMIYDKLSKNHFLYFDQTMLTELWEEFKSKKLIDKIYNPLIKKYENKVLMYCALEDSIQDHSIERLKYFIKYFKIDDLSNSKNLYYLFDLLDLSIEVWNIEISRYIFSLINQFKESYFKETLNNYESFKGEEELDNLEILKFNPFNYEKLFYSIISNIDLEKYQFVKNELGLNLEELIIKYGEINQNQNLEINNVSVNISQVLPDIQFLLLMNGFEILNFKEKYIFGYKDIKGNKSKIHVIIKMLEFSKNVKNLFENGTIEPYMHKMSWLIKNSENLVNGVSKGGYGLYGLFGSYIIYYYLKKRSYDKIRAIVNGSVTKTRVKIVWSVLNYSISRLSIESFDFYKELIKTLGTHYNPNIKNYMRFKDFQTELSEEKAESFFNYLIKNNHQEEISTDSIFFKKITKQFSLNFIEYMVNKYKEFEKLYIQESNIYMFENIKISSEKRNYYLNLFFRLDDPSNSIFHFFEIDKNLVNILLKFGEEKNFCNDIDDLFYKIKSSQDFETSIQYYKAINEDILYNYYKDRNFLNNFYLNKSNILLYQLVNSILNIDLNKLNLILNLINGNSNNEIFKEYKENKEIDENKESLKLLSLLFKKQLLNNFNSEFLLEEIFKQFSNISKTSEQILNCLSIEFINDNLELINKKYIFNSIDLYYSLNQIINMEEYKYLEDEIDSNEEFIEESSNNVEFLDEIDDKEFEKINEILFLFYKLRYNQVLEKLNEYGFSNGDNENNGWSCIRISINMAFNKNISIEWFDKLFNPIIISFFNNKNYNDQFSMILDIVRYRFDLFEYLWSSFFKDDSDRIKFITKLLNCNFQENNLHSLIEYILESKQEFIKNNISIKNNNDPINNKEEKEYEKNEDYEENEENKEIKEINIHDCCINALLNNNLNLFKLLINTFSSYKFNLDSKDLNLFFESFSHRYKILKYLCENGYLTNLGEILKEIPQFKTNWKFSDKSFGNYHISISTLLLFQSILIEQQK